MPAPRPSDRRLARAKTPEFAASYSDLLRKVRSVLFTGQVRIEHAWLLMFHDIGRFIHEHLLLHEDRADYAAKTFSRLSTDTGVSKRVLYEWVRFFPSDWDDYARDRLDAWFRVAWRFAAEGKH